MVATVSCFPTAPCQLVVVASQSTSSIPFANSTRSASTVQSLNLEMSASPKLSDMDGKSEMVRLNLFESL